MALNLEFKTLSVLELFKRIKNAKDEWKLKTPMQKWCYFYSMGKVPLGLLRIPLMNDVNRVHWFAYFYLVYGSIVILLSLNTVLYYACRGEFELGLPSTCMALLFFGVCNRNCDRF